MTLVLRTQDSGLNPEFQHPVRQSRPAIKSDRMRGHFRRRARVEHKTRGHQLIWSEGTKGEELELRRLWAQSGCALPMKYTPVGKTDVDQVEVVFVPGTLSIRQSGPDKFAMSVEVEELPHSDPTSIASTGDLNVIVFVADDVSREYYAAYDNASYSDDPLPSHWANAWDTGTFPYPPTPIFDDLANNGLLLTRMNVAAMCSPTRAALQTGRSNDGHTLGNAIQTNAPIGPSGDSYRFSGKSIYQLMEEQGRPHERAHIGKWHITDHYAGAVDGVGPNQDSTIAAHRKVVELGHATYYSGSLANFGSEAPGFGSGVDQDHTQYVWARHDDRDNPRAIAADAGGPYSGDVTFDCFWNATKHSLVRTTEEARQVILDADEDGKPFLMHVWYHLPHDPTGWNEMGGATLSSRGYHSYGTDAPNGSSPADDATYAGNSKAATESIDTSMGQILAALTPSQLAKTMVVFLADNGSTSDMLTPYRIVDNPDYEDILEAGKDTVPDSDYNPSHSKRSPWQGGIGAACIINGPAVVNPGDGTTPRVWNGLCGVEDVFRLVAEWTGTQVPSDGYETPVLAAAVKDTSPVGRESYIQVAFQNGYQNDPFSLDQGGQIRFVSAQNHAGRKLLWVRAGGELDPNTIPPSPATLTSVYPDEPEASWLWQFYDMTTNALEANAPDEPTHSGDMFWKPKPAWTDTEVHDYELRTPQVRYLALQQQKPDEAQQFASLYNAVAARGLVPPHMEIAL